MECNLEEKVVKNLVLQIQKIPFISVKTDAYGVDGAILSSFQKWCTISKL